jgi:hypothetical protein
MSVQAAYLITRIPDIGLPGRAAQEVIWYQYVPPPFKFVLVKKPSGRSLFARKHPRTSQFK